MLTPKPIYEYSVLKFENNIKPLTQTPCRTL